MHASRRMFVRRMCSHLHDQKTQSNAFFLSPPPRFIFVPCLLLLAPLCCLCADFVHFSAAIIHLTLSPPPTLSLLCACTARLYQPPQHPNFTCLALFCVFSLREASS